jgi:hypothetical protein
MMAQQTPHLPTGILSPTGRGMILARPGETYSQVNIVHVSTAVPHRFLSPSGRGCRQAGEGFSR